MYEFLILIMVVSAGISIIAFILSTYARIQFYKAQKELNKTKEGVRKYL
jgi:hypothetical protein